MIRIVIENLLLLLLPTLIYIAYAYLVRGKGKRGGNVMDDAPLVWLLVAGVALALAVVAIFGTLDGAEPGTAYRPPVFKDGKIIPGELVDDSDTGKIP